MVLSTEIAIEGVIKDVKVFLANCEATLARNRVLLDNLARRAQEPTP